MGFTTQRRNCVTPHRTSNVVPSEGIIHRHVARTIRHVYANVLSLSQCDQLLQHSVRPLLL